MPGEFYRELGDCATTEDDTAGGCRIDEVFDRIHGVFLDVFCFARRVEVGEDEDVREGLDFRVKDISAPRNGIEQKHSLRQVLMVPRGLGRQQLQSGRLQVSS